MTVRLAGIGLASLMVALVAGGPLSAKVTRSISTKFVEVLIEGVPVGSRYVLEAKPVEVLNKSDLTMRLRYDAVVPDPSKMRPGYEPIPDAAWVSFEPRTFEVPRGEKASGKVVLYIPDDPKLVGRRFQVMLRLHGDPSRGSMLSIGLKPRLLFSIRGKEDPDREPRVVDFPRMKARIMPYEFGSEKPEMVFDCGSVTAHNYWEEEMTYEVVPDPEAIRRILVEKGETPIPDMAWIRVLPQLLVLSPHSKAEMAVTVHVPVADEHYGKRYVAALRTVATRKGVETVDVYNKLRVIVPEAPSAEVGKGEVE